MIPKFKDGTRVRMHDDVIASAPAYAGRIYTILSATAEWGIGADNEWYGNYSIQDENGNKAITRESCIVEFSQ